MATGDITAYQEQADGTNKSVKINGLLNGNVALIPIPMAAMPVAKSRLDVHQIEQSLGTIAQQSGSFSITGLTGLLAFSFVRIWMSTVPGSGQGTLADFTEFEQIQISAEIVNDTSMKCYWIATGPVIGNYKFIYQFRT